MNDRAQFNPLQAQEVAKAFAEAGVDYLFIGKGGAILLGFPGTTQDVDVFPAKDADNGRRLVTAVRQLGFVIDDTVEHDIIAGKDFIQLTDGPFDLVIVFAPDGIENYNEAKRRAVTEGIFPVANIRDIVASKKASNRMKDRMDLHLLDLFRMEYELRQ
ncbi:MAG: hypothetical protein ACOVJ6_13075 [Pirellulales bacterium]|jgi:hypothetical protein